MWWWPFKKKQPTQTFWWPEDEAAWQREVRALNAKQTQKLLGAEDSIPVGSVHEALNIYVGRQLHVASEQCGYDRSASINEDTYVCTCGWRAAPKDVQ